MEANEEFSSESGRRRKSSPAPVNTSTMSQSASLYESIGSLTYSDISSLGLDSLELEDIISKNKEGFEFISSRLTSLGYLFSEFAGRRSRNRPQDICKRGTDRISENSKASIKNGDILPAEATFFEEKIKRVVSLTRVYEDNGSNLEKNKKELESLQDELTELNGILEEFARSAQGTEVEENGVHCSCKCEVF